MYLREFKDSSIAPEPDIQASIVSYEAGSGVITLNVTSSALAAFVSLETPIAGHFSENNFMLLPWRPRTLTFHEKGDAKVTADMFLDRLEILSLADLGRQSALDEDCPAHSGNCSSLLEQTDSASSEDNEQKGPALSSGIQAS